MSALSYPQQQLALTGLIVVIWVALELVPARWWSRGRDVGLRVARYIGGTVLGTMAMIQLRRSSADWPPADALTHKWTVFLVVLLAAALLLSRREYLRRFASSAGPDELGVVRFAIGLILAYLVAREDLVSTLILPKIVMRKVGLGWGLHAKLGDAQWLLDIRSLTWLRVVYWSALVSGITTMLGLCSRISAVILAISFTLFYHTLCTYSHFFHVGLVPLLVLYVLLFFPTGAGFSLDALIRKRRNKAPIEAPPEVWTWGVYTAWLMYGLGYWAAGLSKLSQPSLWDMTTLRKYAVRDSDILIEFDFDLAQRLVAWNVDEWVFGPAAWAVLIVEVAGVWVLFSPRARRWLPPLLVSFHIGVVYLQGIVFFDLILFPLAFIPAQRYRQLAAKLRVPVGAGRGAPELGAAIDWRGRNLVRLLALSCLPALLITGWLFRVERFPLLTRWGMFEVVEVNEFVESRRLYAVYEDGRRERTDLTEDIPALTNTLWRDQIGWPRGSTIERKNQLLRNQRVLNAAGKVHNARHPDDRIIRYELEKVRWELEADRDNPNWGEVIELVPYVVGDKTHPQVEQLDRILERQKQRQQQRPAARR